MSSDTSKGKEKPPPVAARSSLRKLTKEISGPSIKSVMAGKEDGEDKLSVREKHELFSQVFESEILTEENVLLKWAEFLDSLSDHPNLKSTLNRNPVLYPDGTLHLQIESQMQDELIKSNKPQIVGWLRRELKNSALDIVTEVTKESSRKKAYTDREKYDDMVRKNAALALLKQHFQLDFDDFNN